MQCTILATEVSQTISSSHCLPALHTMANAPQLAIGISCYAYGDKLIICSSHCPPVSAHSDRDLQLSCMCSLRPATDLSSEIPADFLWHLEG